VFFRPLLVVVFAVTCSALAPADGAAQQRTPDRSAAVAGQTAAGVGGQAAPQAEPRGLHKAFGGKAPPAALQRVFPRLFAPPAPTPDVPLAPDVGEAPSPTPSPEPAPCGTSIEFVGGEFVLVDCHGNVVSP